MKTLRIEGTQSDVSFYEDDTIERVRELIAIDQGSHPDRLFIQIRVTLPPGYYGTPREWTDLFFRLSRDGRTVAEEELRLYLTQVRAGVSDFPVRAYTQEQWEAVEPTASIRDGGPEWHILGAERQPVVPLPPKDVDLPASMAPLLRLQSLVETLHAFDSAELRVTTVPADPSDAVLRVYFPRLDPKRTPVNLDASKGAILQSQEMLGKLLALKGVAKHRSAVLTKAKWYISLNATRIPSPRATFEQIFYGLTLSKTTPFIGYYMPSETALRSKFYVEEPTTKTPVLKPALVKGWYDMTAPNRRRPTLLLYRGSARGVFQRIAITSLDITIDIRKDKTSTKTLKDLKAEAEEWLLSLDAVVPFLDPRDLSPERWQLGGMSLLASYAKEETQFDMRRFDCLRSIFGEEGGKFRMLRVDQGTVSRRVLDACQALSQDDVAPNAESLATALGTSVAEAKALLDPILSGEVDCDRALREFPLIRFDRSEVEIDFATNPERILTYVDILRYALTTKDDISGVCPSRPESVPALSIVPQNAPVEEDDDEDGFDISSMTVSTTAAPAPAPAPPVAKKGRTLQVAKEKENTQNYFNKRLEDFDEANKTSIFASPYSKECEKNNQVLVLPKAKEETKEEETKEEEANEAKEETKEEETEETKLKKHYAYEDAPPEERLSIPGGIAICPPYWCMTDLIPLREEDLKTDEEGVKHCPLCNGKVRLTDKASTREYPVIKRETSKGQVNRYPRFMRNRKDVPCCYPTPEKTPASKSTRVDENYVLSDTFYDLEPKRAGRLSEELATRLGVKTSYDTTIVNKRLDFDTEDIFRIGLGPLRTKPNGERVVSPKFWALDVLPELLGLDATAVPHPRTREDILRQCSFYETTGKADAREELARRWDEKTMDPLDQIEYMSFFLNYSVILVAADRNKVLCGFQSDRVAQDMKTIVILTRVGKYPEVLGAIRRKKKRVRGGPDVSFVVNLEDAPLKASSLSLLKAHREACAKGLPHIETARKAINKLNLTLSKDEGVEPVVDAYGRLQYFFVKGTVLLPFVPVPLKMTEYNPKAVLRLHEIPEADLPSYESQTSLLDTPAIDDVFRHEPSKDHLNGQGQIVEVETVTGFRIPVRPPTTRTLQPGPRTEVLQTLRATPEGEETLLSGQPDPEGPALKAKLDYSSELYEFLLFSLAKDIAEDRSGDALTDYSALRDAIVARSPTALTAELTKWYAAEARETDLSTEYKFLSKVRTPCGQLLKEETCQKASLCGWVASKETCPRGKKACCKVQVRPTLVDSDLLLKRIHRTLVENDKQRALVLDNRLSRFFSTQLYQELPHELITVL